MASSSPTDVVIMDHATPQASSLVLATPSSSVFGRLPDEIIQQILSTADPDSFASLVLVNRQIRRVSQRAHFYASQLRRCASYPSTHVDLTKVHDDDLPRLRRQFALEVRRSLFNAYSRPSETLVKLVSKSISSSSCPGGEGMQFSASSKGHYLLAYNSSRIYLVGVQDVHLQINRELKIIRRPVSATITDDATTLILVSTEMQVYLYDLAHTPPRRSRTIILDKNPRAIAVSSCGSVMATAYDTGIEVSSLHPDALPNQQRQVKCDAVDMLAFSFDGTQILGTTVHSSPPNTVVLTAPYYDPGPMATQDDLSALWTRSILFPNTSHDCSHAVLLQNGTQEEALWAFAYDRSFDSFRAIRIDDLRNGTTYFTGPVPMPSSQSKLLPCTLPAAAYHAQLVAAGFHGSQIWVYSVPEDLDAIPECQVTGSDSSVGLGRRISNRSVCSRNDSSGGRDDDDDGRVPQWQLLCDKLRNNFVAGRKVAELSGMSMIKWVEGFVGSSTRDRLLVTSSGISAAGLATEEENIDFVDGGRICMLDFEYGPRSGSKREIVIEVGTDDAELLEEEQRDMETEVAIVRRRTVAQNRAGRSQMLGAATTVKPNLMACRIPDGADVNSEGKSDRSNRESTTSMDEMDALDAPYSHTNPRSRMTLRRAATAAAMNRQLNAYAVAGQSVVYRRADGQDEVGHEIDADDWVPPPPPYQAEDPVTLPVFLRRPAVSLLPSAAQALPSLAQRQQDTAWPVGPSTPQNEQVYANRNSHSMMHQRTASDSMTSGVPRSDPGSRPLSTPPAIAGEARVEEVDLYGVSPRVSPAPECQTTDATAEEAERGNTLTEVPQSERTWVTAEAAAQDDIWVASEHVEPLSQSSQGDMLMPSVEVAKSQLSPIDEAPRRDCRLSNAQTWPLIRRPQPQPPGLVSVEQDGNNNNNNNNNNNKVQSAGATDVALCQGRCDIVPPPPSIDQIERLNRRISMGTPRRLSGGISNQWAVPGFRSSLMQPPRAKLYTVESRQADGAALVNPDEDQPLIISTPEGVSGAFDSPGQTQILAPVPRRPLKNIPFSPVERTACAPSLFPGLSDQGPSEEQKKGGGLPVWLSSTGGGSGSRRSPVRVRRRPSRAERGAAKIIFDARKRGWKPRSRKKSKKAQEGGGEDSEWSNDVAAQAPTKEHKKCVVM